MIRIHHTSFLDSHNPQLARPFGIDLCCFLSSPPKNMLFVYLKLKCQNIKTFPKSINSSKILPLFCQNETQRSPPCIWKASMVPFHQSGLPALPNDQQDKADSCMWHVPSKWLARLCFLHHVGTIPHWCPSSRGSTQSRHSPEVLGLSTMVQPSTDQSAVPAWRKNCGSLDCPNWPEYMQGLQSRHVPCHSGHLFLWRKWLAGRQFAEPQAVPDCPNTAWSCMVAEIYDFTYHCVSLGWHTMKIHEMLFMQKCSLLHSEM